MSLSEQLERLDRAERRSLLHRFRWCDGSDIKVSLNVIKPRKS